MTLNRHRYKRSSVRGKTSPRKSAQDYLDSLDYPTALTKLCREADVLIIPAVQRYTDPERRALDRRNTAAPAPTRADAEDFESGGQPPTVQVLYDGGDIGDSPVGLVCKAFYVEYALIEAVFKSFPIFPTISCLRIEDCCISREVVRILAALLADHMGRGIVDLSLDGNSDIGEELPSLLRTDLRYLSLKRCSIDDEAASLLSQELRYDGEREQNLVVLNLNMNCIGDEGAAALAAALRTNRTLTSLSLCGNRITDAGACRLAEVLGKFALTHEEVMCRRRRTFRRLLLKKAHLDRHLEDWRLRTEAESQMKMKSAERLAGKRTKSLDVGSRRPSASSRDRRRSNSTRMSSREKLRGRKKSGGAEGASIGPEPSSAELKEMLLQVEAEVPTDRHPFMTEVTAGDGELWCDGSWKLGHLNLSYNRLTEHSLCQFLSVVYYQDSNFEPPCLGLLRLVIQPGTLIPKNSCQMSELECALKGRLQRKGNPSDAPLPGQQQSEPAKAVPSPRKK